MYRKLGWNYGKEHNLHEELPISQLVDGVDCRLAKMYTTVEIFAGRDSSYRKNVGIIIKFSTQYYHLNLNFQHPTLLHSEPRFRFVLEWATKTDQKYPGITF